MTRQTATVPRLDVPGPPGIPLLGSALDLRRDLLATLNRPTVATVTSFVSPIHPAAVPPPRVAGYLEVVAEETAALIVAGVPQSGWAAPWTQPRT